MSHFAFSSWAAPKLAEFLSKLPEHTTINLALVLRPDGLENMVCEAVLPSGDVLRRIIRETRG